MYIVSFFLKSEPKIFGFHVYLPKNVDSFHVALTHAPTQT